jgi:hypothetical protein
MQRIYRRDGQEVVVEIAPDQRDGDYRLRILWPDGREVFETFSNERITCRRLDTLESQLLPLHWVQEAEPRATSPSDTDLRSDDACERRAGISDRRRVTRRDRRSRTS